MQRSSSPLLSVRVALLWCNQKTLALAHPSKRPLHHMRGYFFLLSLASLLFAFLSDLLVFFASLLDFEVFSSAFFEVSVFLLGFALDLEDLPDLARQ